MCALLRASIAKYSKHIALGRQCFREQSQAPAANAKEAAEAPESDAAANDDSVMSNDSEDGGL